MPNTLDIRYLISRILHVRVIRTTYAGYSRRRIIMKRNQVISAFYAVLGFVLTYCLASSMEVAINGPFDLMTTMNGVLFALFVVGDVAVYAASVFAWKNPGQFN